LGIESAGGIDQQAARPRQGAGRVEQGPLPRGAAGHVRGRPVGHRGGVAAEHRFAGARRVDQHAVEEGRRPRGQYLGRHAQYGSVGDAPPFQRPSQLARSSRVDVVGHEQAPPGQAIGDGGRLAARRGAEVEHALARLRVEHGDRRQGRGVLGVERADAGQRMRGQPRPLLRGGEQRRRPPGDDGPHCGIDVQRGQRGP